MPSGNVKNYGLEAETIAVLNIPTLDFSMPVYLGANEENMAAGAAHMCSLSPEQMKHCKEKFKNAEILLGAKGNEPITLKVEAYHKQTTEKAGKGKNTPERWLMASEEKIKALTEKLESGVKAVFESEKYKAYLKAMSKFHNYSFGNIMLILKIVLSKEPDV